jgi:predicted RNA binding protein YcfA (HicA-like mRNA interferase family)
MSRLPRWTAADAEREILRAGMMLLRSKGSHRIYGLGKLRVTIPFHSGEILHPKIVRQAVEAIEEAQKIQSH